MICIDCIDRIISIDISIKSRVMLAKIAPKFVISRVIQNSYFAEKMSVELLKQPLGKHVDYFGMIDSQKYYVHILLEFNSGVQILQLHRKSKQTERLPRSLRIINLQQRLLKIIRLQKHLLGCFSNLRIRAISENSLQRH